METRAEDQRLVKGSHGPSKPRRAYGEVIRDWIVRFALNSRQELNTVALQGYQQLWESAFADVPLEVLVAAFEKTLRECKFMPTVADVLTHVKVANSTASQEEAERKWQEVLRYIRLHYNPDISTQSGQPIGKRTGRAIEAAGGLPYLSECEPEAKQWARKRFIESYLRSEELEQNFNLLPEGKFKNELKALAVAKSLPQLNPPR
jgi:hypothetical protein